MRKRFFCVIFAFTILITSTGFGFLESSTIKYGYENRQIEADSIKNTSSRFTFSNHPTNTKKEIENHSHTQITKSIIQWVANTVKIVLQVVITFIVDAMTIILLAIIKFFIH